MSPQWPACSYCWHCPSSAAQARPAPARLTRAIAGRSLAASQTSVDFGPTTVGGIGGGSAADVTLTNNGTTADAISGFTIGGADPDDFFEFDDCGPNAIPAGPLLAGKVATS